MANPEPIPNYPESVNTACIQAPQALDSRGTWFTTPPPSIPRGRAANASRQHLSGPSGPDSCPPGGSADPQPHTEVHPDEIIVGRISGLINGDEYDRRASLHQSFRHSFWKARRSATLSAFRNLSLPDSRIDRFTGCGSVSWVLRAKDTDGVFRIATNGCRDRWCEACSSEKRRTIVRNVRDKLEGYNLRLLTLTLKSRNDTLVDQLNRLYACFRKFRNRSKIKRLMTGGIYFVELTINQTTDLWHPHLHVLFDGDYLPKHLASAEWLSCTDDSFIIDIAKVRDSGHAAGYVAKYASKAIPKSVWNNQSRFHEAILAFAGRRLFSYFGTFQGLDLSKNPADDIGWDTIAPLFQIIDLSQRGDRYARLIITFLTGGAEYESFDLLDSS